MDLPVNKAPDPASNQQEQESSPADERQWLALAKQGDEEAFGMLVKFYQQRVFSVAYRFVQNTDEANDLAQQAWIKAWRKLPGFKGEAAFFTWMYRVVSFVCLDHLRKRRRLSEFELLEGVQPHRAVGAELAASTATRPDRELEHREIRQRFQEALKSLSPDQRMALTMREVDGLSYQEIAKAMRCRKGTVMSRIFYARKNLQEELRDLR